MYSKSLFVLMFALTVFTLSPAQNSQSDGLISSAQKSLHLVSRETKGLRSPNGAKIIATGSAKEPSISEHERFVTFLSGDGFESELLLQNMRLDVPVTANISLIVDGREVSLDPVTILAHAASTVDISSELRRLGFGNTNGMAVVRYDAATYAAMSAVVTASNEARHLYLNFSGKSGEELWSGNTFDAVVWSPDPDTHGFLSLINTYNGPTITHLSFIVDGHPEEGREITLAPHEQRFIQLDSVLRRSFTSGTGIHLEFTGDPGSLLPEATLLNQRTGFSKHIQFADKALHFATQTSRTHFLLLGQQPPEDGFPDQMSFRSVAVVRNIDSAPVQVTPVVKFLRNGLVQSLSLKPLTLGVNQSQLIDFKKLKESGVLPRDFVQGSLELTPNTDHTSIVSELFNYDEAKKGYVVGPSFGAHPMRSTSSIWRTDGTFQTTIMIENTADRDDQVTLQLFSGPDSYEKLIEVSKGALVKINLKDLQKNHVPDKNGKFLTVTSGTLHLSGSHGGRSALAFDKLIHSSSDSEYVGLPAQPCDFVTDFFPFLDSNNNSWITEDWTDGSQDTLPEGPFSWDSTYVTVTSNSVGPLLIFNPSPTGGAFSTNLTYEDIVLDCTACSTREQFNPMTASLPIPDHLFVLGDSSSTQNCGSAPASEVRAITYLVKDQNDIQILTHLNFRENVPTTTSSCNNNVVHTGTSCISTFNTVPGVIGEFADVISPGCAVPASNSPCGFTFTNQQWQYCPASGVPQSMGTVGQVNAENILITVAGQIFSLVGHVFLK